MEVGIDALKTYSELMSERMALPDVGGHALLPHWIKELEKIRRDITRMIRNHTKEI
jgi:hypothetical protein